MAGEDKVPVIALAGSANPGGTFISSLSSRLPKQDSTASPGDHFGAVGLVAIVKSNMALQVVSAGDHVCAGSVPVRHLEGWGFGGPW